MEGSWNNIPQELKDKRQWVCYMMPVNPEKGKPDKIPINPHTLWGASYTNPDTWGTFQDAVEQVGKTGHYKRKDETISSPIVGIGFVFNGDGVVGADFDHCIVDGKMDPWVGEWIRRFNSYVEFSPSDTGVHILCYGKLPRKSIKLDVAEIYDRGRFFTMTGKGPPRPLCEAQQAIDDLGVEVDLMRGALTAWVSEAGDPAFLAQIKAYKDFDLTLSRTELEALVSGAGGNYDSMLKADKMWVPDQSLEFPMPMDDAVDVIAELMGITVDPRTQVSHTYTIDYPANDYTLRDVLKFIAVANGGNWTITRNDQLLLVPLVGSMPPETHYLIEENGDAITFGGIRILV